MSFSFTEPTSTHPTPSQETAPDATDTTTTPDVVTDNPNVVPVVENGTVPENTGSATDTPNGGAEPVPTDGEPQPNDAEAVPLGECYFGDEAVTIDIPQDVTDALKEHGLDAVAIANELYAKGGEFKLSAETKEALDKVYGKFAVDAYISGIKAQNEGTLARGKHEAEAAEKANGERFDVVSKEVGGAEGWGALERFALDTLPDAELEAFNEVMSSGNQYLQMYAVRELESRRKVAQGDDKVTLVDATGAASGDASNAPLSGADYIREIAGLGKKYGNDRVARAAAESALDARRMAGMKAGL